MKLHLPVIAAGIAAFTSAVGLAADQGAQSGANTSPPPAMSQNQPTAPRASGADAGQTAALGEGVGDVLRMADAGVSKDVIKVYIESSSVAYNLRAADLIAIKQRGLPDDVATAMLKHGAELRTQNAGVVGANVAPDTSNPDSSVNSQPLMAAMNATGQPYFNPEGHDYWFYHYAYPRTLSFAYERLAPYNSPYGYYPATPYGFAQPYGASFSFGGPRFGGRGFGPHVGPRFHR